MKTLRYIILCLMAFVGLAAMAQKATFSILPPRSAVEGAKFTVTLRVTNGNSIGNPPDLQLKGCTKIYGPVRQSTQSYSIVNGQASSQSYTDFVYTFRADNAGMVTIPAQTITVDGQKLTTEVSRFNVLPPDASSSQSGASSRQQQPSMPSSGVVEPEKISSEDMFIRIFLNKQQVYEQEALVATVKIYSRYNISSIRTISQPSFDGFFSEDVPTPTNAEVEHYNGKNYYTCVLRKCVLYPQKAGKLTITSGEYELTVVQYQRVPMGFFGYDNRPVETPVTTKTNSVTANVIPLPTPKPNGFNGAVGHYDATVEMRPTELRANEVTSYIYKIKGTGNVKFLKTPVLNLPPGIDRLTPKTDIDAAFTGSDMKGSFTVNYSLIPQNPGEVEIPAQQFSYFDPQDKQYHTIDLQSFVLQVAKPANSSTAMVEQQTIAKGMTDILHIKQIDDNLRPTPAYVFRSGIYWLLYVVAALALAIVLYAYRRNLKIRADVAGRKMAKANKVASKRLKAARELMAKHDSGKFYIELNQAMSGYLSDKFGIPASKLVRENIATNLASHGVEQSVIDDAINVLDECEMARFASTGSDQAMASLLDKAASTIKAIQESYSDKPIAVVPSKDDVSNLD